MTVTAGARPSKRQVGGSAPASARAADGPLPVASGGTGGTTAPEARVNLGVPGLGDANVFTGTNNEFMELLNLNGGVSVQGGLTVDGDASVTGEVAVTGLLRPNGGIKFDGFNIDFTGNLALSPGLPVVNCTSGSPTVRLEAAVTNGGVLHIIKNSGTGTITLATTGGDTIDGALTQTLAPYNSITVVSTGSAWIIV